MAFKTSCKRSVKLSGKLFILNTFLKSGSKFCGLNSTGSNGGLLVLYFALASASKTPAWFWHTYLVGSSQKRTLLFLLPQIMHILLLSAIFSGNKIFNILAAKSLLVAVFTICLQYIAGFVTP